MSLPLSSARRLVTVGGALAVAAALSTGGVAVAKGGGSGGGGGTTTPPASSGAWPTTYPLPTSPGTITAQSATRATVRSTDTVGDVVMKLDSKYAALGCTRTVAVNKPRDYFCRNASGKTDEVYFTFAALDPTAADASRSQTNAFLAQG